jgi:hypothetical protein
MKIATIAILVLVICAMIYGCTRSATTAPVSQGTEIDSDLNDLNTLDQETDSSSLDQLENDLDIQI